MYGAFSPAAFQGTLPGLALIRKLWDKDHNACLEEWMRMHTSHMSFGDLTADPWWDQAMVVGVPCLWGVKDLKCQDGTWTIGKPLESTCLPCLGVFALELG